MNYNEAIRLVYYGYDVTLPEWTDKWLTLSKKDLMVITDETEYESQLTAEEIIEIVKRTDFKIIVK